MAIMGMIPAGATPGARARALAESMGKSKAAFKAGTLNGPELMLYQKLSSLMCWDAALLCAWAAKGIESGSISLAGGASGIVQNGSPNPLFANSKPVKTAAELMAMPDGCFVGFINTANGELRHVMLHTTNGHGAGNKSGCIFSDSENCWEELDMGQFFFKDAGNNVNTSIIYTPTNGQTL